VTTRRTFLAAMAGATLAGRVWRPRAARPVPSPSQLAWQRAELAMFCHFGMNTFTDREWGDGREDPALFNPTAFDADQWAHVAKVGGFRTIILTAKHHDGFCLWPTATTRHSVASSPWRNGQGDVVAEVSAACRRAGLGFGVYLSPWDRNHLTYGDSPRYNDVYEAQLTELLTRYGPIEEAWFDGANGEGPNGKGQVYDWTRIWGTVRRLQPEAVIFSDAGPDVRWIGNEKGIAGDPCWATVDPLVVPYPGADGPDVMRMLQHGDPEGLVFRPGESDVSIRPGWFWHPAEDDKVRSVDNLLELYASSVGRNSKLLLNVPPTREGRIHEVDATRLAEFGQRRTAWLSGRHPAMLRDASGTLGAEVRFLRGNTHLGWSPPGAGTTGWLEVRYQTPVECDTVSLREAIGLGQHVARYTLELEEDGRWRRMSEGTTIGHRKLDRFPLARATALRVTVLEAYARPVLSAVSLHRRTAG
jgi:alpha-L-fucosidase